MDEIADAEPGVWMRRLDAEIVPPLSDYAAFWSAGIAFVFLTCGRWQHYHTPNNTPEKLDYPKMAALARWLERWTRDTCARSEPRIRFANTRDDAASVRTLIALTQALEPIAPRAALGRRLAESLLARCDARGRLAKADLQVIQALMHELESDLG